MPVDVSKFIKGMQEKRQRVIAAAVTGVDVFGEHVIGDAQQITPVKTGALQASGTTEEAKVDGTSVSKTIGFNTHYAAAVHERLDSKHAVGQAKFLETSMTNNAP